LSRTTVKLLAGFKYAYLIAFFALLSGFFYPLITDTSFDSVIIGVIVLFIGLLGGILLYKSAVPETTSVLLLGGGFVLISISLFYIFQIIGTV
jgi:hypothetical protein